MRWLDLDLILQFVPVQLQLLLPVGPRRLLMSHGITILEVECTDRIQSCEVNSSYPHEVTQLEKIHLSG